jgi:peptide/nickel transport system substrate-binding protein
MKGKRLWFTIGAVFAVVSVLAACGNGGAGTTTAPTGTTSDKPQYGGTINLLLANDVTNFEPVTSGQLIGPAVAWTTNEQWVQYDWSRGLAGTAQTDWLNAGASLDDFMPYLMESVTYPKPGVMVFKVRQGIHYGLNPKSPASVLVNGREMTADDLVSNMNKFINHPNSFFWNNYQWLPSKIKVTKTGPWEVTFDVSAALADEMRVWHWLVHGGGYHFVFPPELWDKYGDLKDWKNNVGTGAWLLTDFVSGSTVTLTKNSNYWMKDPVGPGKGNKLPYADSVTMFILPDLSARLAALRTGKADLLGGLTADTAKSLTQTTPDLKSVKYLDGFNINVVGMRIDKQDLPYKDKRVRQALMYATDFNGLVAALGGDAEISSYPVNQSFKRAHMPMNELPANVQDLYKYNPDKAKKLLADAGYPNGFKAQIACNSDPAIVDILSAYKAMWAKVGVTLEIQPKEIGVWFATLMGHQNQDMIFSQCYSIFPVTFYFGNYAEGNFANSSNVNWPAGSEPTIQKYYEQVTALAFTDPAGADKVIHDMTPYVLENAWYIPTPETYKYNFWWPWLKNSHGEANMAFLQYFWIDQTLKKSMGK